MKLDGRCSCGMVMEWVARKPDEHLRCFGLRWCGACGEAAEYIRGGDGKCPACAKRHRKAYIRRRGRPKTRPVDLEHSRRARALQRRTRAPQYLAELERKRVKYATDKAWREAKLAAVAAAYALAHPEPVKDGRATLARAARGTLRGRVHESSVSMARGQEAA